MAKISTFTPSERTFRRIKNNPANALSSSLFAYAESVGLPMEAIMGKPIYIFGLRIDGYVEWKGFIYAYSSVIPKKPVRSCLYVYEDAKGNVLLSRKKEDAERIGVCVAKIKLLQTEDTNKIAIVKFGRRSR